MFPNLVKVKQQASAPVVENIRDAVIGELGGILSGREDLAGKTIGITAGSRGIYAYSEILRAVADTIGHMGAKPVIIPSMGSHGEAGRQGRLQILNSLGISQETIGVEIVDAEDFVHLGRTPSAIPVYVTGAVRQVDGLIVVNRVKEHTDFSGRIESGIQKMMTIGLGSYKGCSTAHAHALILGLERTITEVAAVIMNSLPILVAVAVLENYRAETAAIKAILPGDIPAVEETLLAQAKELSIKLPFDKIDVLVVGEIGKNISGACMDSKVIGRIRIQGQTEPDRPDIKRIVVLSLTPESHGNALGIGVADMTTRRAYEAMNVSATVINAIAGASPEHAAIPCILESDRDAVQAAMKTCGVLQHSDIRMVYIQNTLKLDKMAVSESLLDEVAADKRLSILGKPEPMRFDEKGNLLNFRYEVQ